MKTIAKVALALAVVCSIAAVVLENTPYQAPKSSVVLALLQSESNSKSENNNSNSQSKSSNTSLSGSLTGNKSSLISTVTNAVKQLVNTTVS